MGEIQVVFFFFTINIEYKRNILFTFIILQLQAKNHMKININYNNVFANKLILCPDYLKINQILIEKTDFIFINL